MSYLFVAYLIGWFYKLAYLQAFDALWLLSYLTPMDYLRSSAFPAVILGAFIAVAAKHTLELKGPALVILGSPSGPWSRPAVRGIYAFAGGLVVLAGALGGLAWVLQCLGLFIIVMGAYKLVRHFANIERVGPLGLGVLLAALLFAVPLLLGGASGRLDVDPVTSSLPVIRSDSIESLSPRALLFTDERVFWVDLRSPRRVHLIDIAKVDAIDPAPRQR